MTSESNVIQEAKFNPKIKRYTLFAVAFFMTISVAGIPLLVFWFLGLGQKICGRFYENLSCKLTSQHLEFKKGVLFKIEKTIPLENIQDLTFIENPLLKYFDLRILKIETAGQSHPQGSDMKLIGIIDALEFKKKILSQRELLKTNIPVSSSDEFNNQESIDLLKEIRDILNDIKKK